MIDLHCHILPGLDDGAVDMADSVAMARQAEADGIEVVCATPHIRHDHDVIAHEIRGRVAQVNAELERLGIGVLVAAGGELAETSEPGLDDSELREISLCGTGRWALLEPAPGPISDSLEEAVERLRARGTRSVIAHPERHAGHDLAERLESLVALGALVQVTAAYLEDPGAGPVLLDLASRGLVHLLGSDAHSARAGRPVALSGGVRALRDVPTLAPHIDWVVREGPEAIRRGEADLSPPF